jgi:hypothetical protein
VYGEKQDLLSFTNGRLYYEDRLSSLSCLSKPKFYEGSHLNKLFDSYTLLVNRYITSTFKNLPKYADYFARLGVTNIIVIENTSNPEMQVEKLDRYSEEERKEISDR